MNKTTPHEVTDALKLIGDDIRAARRVRKLTIEELADRVGVSSKTIQRLEAGDVGTSIGNLMTVAWVLDLEKGLANVFSPMADHVGLREARMNLSQRVRKPAEEQLGGFDI